MKKQDALRIIFECADKYRNSFAGNNFLFICSNAKVINTTFVGANFLHMTGVKFAQVKRIEANAYYDLCLNRRLREADFDLSQDGTTEMKLRVLPRLLNPNMNAKMLGNYSANRPMMFTEKIAGGVSGGIGFVYDEKTGFYVPNTVLNIDIRQLTTDCLRIIAIYRKKIEYEKYNELVYQARKVDWSKVTFPDEYNYLQKLQ